MSDTLELVTLAAYAVVVTLLVLVIMRELRAIWRERERENERG